MASFLVTLRMIHLLLLLRFSFFYYYLKIICDAFQRYALFSFFITELHITVLEFQNIFISLIKINFAIKTRFELRIFIIIIIFNTGCPKLNCTFLRVTVKSIDQKVMRFGECFKMMMGMLIIQRNKTKQKKTCNKVKKLPT